MKRLFLLLCTTILISLPLSAAKQSGSLTGRVIEQTGGTALPFATVAIIADDGSVALGDITNEQGRFELKNVPFGARTLRVSYIGYVERSIDVNVNRATYDLGDIQMTEDSQVIAAAVVTAKIPVIEQKLDKIIMNVSETVSAQGSNTLELLRKAPGVSVDKDGNIMLNGQIVDIWIDGRPSYLSGANLKAMLEGADGTTVDKFEIMAHPSAKYDASGSGGIINIKTKKNFMQGFNGSLTARYGGMMYDRYIQDAGGSLNLNYRSEKNSTTVMYNGSYTDMLARLDSWTKLADSQQTSHSDMVFENNSNNYKITHDYFFDKKNTFGALIGGNINSHKQECYGDDNYTTWDFGGSGNDIIMKSELNSKSDFDNISGNLNFTHIFDESKAKEITVNADYLYYDLGSHSTQTIYQMTSASIAPSVNVISDQYINIFSAKADYQQLFWKSGMLELGAKWAKTNTNNLSSENNLRNDFVYDEQIAAIYATAAKGFSPKFMVKVGLRGEYTFAEGNWKSAQNKSKRSYFNLFPTVVVAYTPSADWRYSLSYSRRVNRPAFSQLNPFKAFLDANSYAVGNPELEPQFTQQVYVNLGIKSHFNVGLLYNYTSNMLMQEPSVDPTTGQKVFMFNNFGHSSMGGAILSLTEFPIWKWMILQASCNALYVNNQNSGENGTYRSKGWMIQANGGLTFLLPKDFKVELSAFGMNGLPMGYFYVKPSIVATAGIKKTILKGQGNLALNINDLFGTMCSDLEVRDISGNTYYTINQGFKMQQITFSFNWRFGQSKATKQRRVGNDEESARVGSTGNGLQINK